MLRGQKRLPCFNGSQGIFTVPATIPVILLTCITCSGALKNILQIGIEFHQVPRKVKVYFQMVQELYKLGFKTIRWDPNLVAFPGRGPINFFEIVFRKTDLEICDSAH
jgi:hypothetical protein